MTGREREKKGGRWSLCAKRNRANGFNFICSFDKQRICAMSISFFLSLFFSCAWVCANDELAAELENIDRNASFVSIWEIHTPSKHHHHQRQQAKNNTKKLSFTSGERVGFYFFIAGSTRPEYHWHYTMVKMNLKAGKQIEYFASVCHYKCNTWCNADLSPSSVTTLCARSECV